MLNVIWTRLHGLQYCVDVRCAARGGCMGCSNCVAARLNFSACRSVVLSESLLKLSGYVFCKGACKVNPEMMPLPG